LLQPGLADVIGAAIVSREVVLFKLADVGLVDATDIANQM